MSCDSPSPEPRLLFVYAREGGLARALFDAAHKALRPSTYPCSLCRLTHGLVAERPRWRRFVEGLELPSEFLHRDEFERRHPEVEIRLPALFLERAGRLRLLADGGEFDRCRDLADLERLISSTLRRVAPDRES